MEEGVKDAHSDNPDFHLRESLSRIQTRINKVNEDKEEYLNPDYYTKWRDNYTKLCEQLSKERDHAEKNSKDSLVKGYGEKYGGVDHDIQDNIQNGKIAGFITELAISIAAGGAASMLAKGFMKAAGKSVLRTLVRQAGVDIATNLAVARAGQAWAIISDATMNDDVKMNGDYWLKQLKTFWDNTVSSTISGMASAGIGTAIGLHSGKFHWKNSEIAPDSPAVKAPTPPPLPAAATKATGKAPVKAETHTHTTSSLSAATESVESTRIVQQSDHADIDDWLYRTRNDDRIVQLSDYQNPKLNNGSGTSATNSAAVNTQNPPPLPAAAKEATGKALVKAETSTHISKWLADIKKAKNKERPIRLLTGNWALLKEIMDPAPVTSFIVIANRLLPSPTNEPPKPDPYFIDRYKKMIEPLKDKTNRADNSEDKNEDAEVSD